MGLTFTRVPEGEDTFGGKNKVMTMDVTFDSSYPTGGEVISAASFGFKILFGLAVLGQNTAAALYTFNYDSQAGTLVALVGGSQVANTTDLSALTVRIRAFGQ